MGIARFKGQATQAFSANASSYAKWIKAEKSAAATKAPKKDAVAEKIAGALKRVAGNKLNFGTYGYTIRRAKGKGSKGLVVTRNVKTA